MQNLPKIMMSFAVLSLVLAPLAQAGESDGTVQINSIRNSGVVGTAALEDSGNLPLVGGTLMVTGFASGLDPSKTYVSLLYDTGSVATGVKACLPTNNSLEFSQMVLGYWLPLGSRTRTLTVVKTGDIEAITDYAALSAIGTMSIRWDTNPTAPLPSKPDPKRFVLQACGKVLTMNDSSKVSNDNQ